MKITDSQKLTEIKTYLKAARKELNVCRKFEREYTTILGNGINCCEASKMLDEVNHIITTIIKQK